jgi:hypothetical protein
MPGTAAGGGFCPAAHRVQLVVDARDGAAFVGAEDSARRAVLVWRVGTSSVARVAGGSSVKQHVALAQAAGDSRLWVGWHDAAADRLMFRRSNPSRSVWGAVVSVPPAAGRSVYELDLAAQPDRVDAIVRAKAASNAVSLAHTQVFPGLSVDATAAAAGRVTVRVTDAGDPVPGATVRIGGRSLRSDARGVVAVDLAPGSYVAVASKPKYVGASDSVRVT